MSGLTDQVAPVFSPEQYQKLHRMINKKQDIHTTVNIARTSESSTDYISDLSQHSTPPQELLLDVSGDPPLSPVQPQVSYPTIEETSTELHHSLPVTKSQRKRVPPK
ncbi:hypothetical protein HAX54_031460 [Datura stramonium]|uniref:Uncharacterized protein n=1 Tax=Datura stramonium TaxID=4076 RepID=A0ABS8SBY0_DATST|nr:hypothetical protein [Datura stramonium]